MHIADEKTILIAELSDNLKWVSRFILPVLGKTKAVMNGCWLEAKGNKNGHGPSPIFYELLKQALFSENCLFLDEHL